MDTCQLVYAELHACAGASIRGYMKKDLKSPSRTANSTTAVSAGPPPLSRHHCRHQDCKTIAQRASPLPAQRPCSWLLHMKLVKLVLRYVAGEAKLILYRDEWCDREAETELLEATLFTIQRKFSVFLGHIKVFLQVRKDQRRI